MKSKELILFGAVAMLLTNLSIIATLVATGFIVIPESDPEPEEVTPEEPIEPYKPAIIHSMSKAMYICEDKVTAANASKLISYEFDPVASRYNEDAGIYSIFIETHSASRAGSPQLDFGVTCDVSDKDLKIVGYKVLPM
jgi:hypothetical protein